MSSPAPAPAALPDPACLRVVAEEAARAGGAVARRYFDQDYHVRLKPDHSEVSEADEAAQAEVIARIQAQRPADAVIAEETLAPGGRPGPTNDIVCWVIDPIDGTRNFIRRIPLYACSIAAMLHGTPIAGAIYDPQRDVMYSAASGGALCVNGGQPPDTAGATRGLNLRPVVGIPSTPRGASKALAHRWLDRYVCRSLGSTALHLAWVAAGRLDAALADNPRLWDLAAGWALLRAARRDMVKLDGTPIFPLDVAAYAGEELPLVAAGSVDRFLRCD